jgi:hypothetical protein
MCWGSNLRSDEKLREVKSDCLLSCLVAYFGLERVCPEVQELARFPFRLRRRKYEDDELGQFKWIPEINDEIICIRWSESQILE